MADPTRETQAEHWGGAAGEHWVAFQARYDDMLREFGLRAVAAAGLRAGERVLDVGCGCGETTLEIARRVGAGGAVLGADLSAPMLARARERAAGEGLGHVRFVEADAQFHPFDAGTFDALTSRFGIMFFEDPPAAFANLARALRPAGRVAFVCWQDVTRNEWMMVTGMAVAQHVGLPEMGAPGAPGPFSLADPDRIRQLLDGTGCERVDIEPLTLPMRLGADVEDAVAFFASTEMARRLFRDAAPERVEAALDALRAAVAPHAGPEGVRLAGSAWLVTAALRGARP